jgi:hypothetical protein
MGRARAALATLLLCAAACRTARPAGEEKPFPPLAAASGDDALRELRARAAALEGARSLMRIRATTGERTQSFRAQLQVSRDAMLLSAYTPLGTSALRLFVRGDQVVFINDVDSTWWRGSTAELARAFGFFGDAPPVSVALLILGLPPVAGGEYEATPQGLARARLGDVTVSYKPPVFPPKRVTVAHGAQRLEIEHLEIGQSTAPVEEPSPPADYRCCVAPHL